MECPSCRSTNPESAKFCQNCGTKLTRTCPNCGTESPAAARFCFNCGNPLESVSSQPAVAHPTASPPSSLSRFMPQELLKKLEQAREAGEMVGERRVVTMLFCDVKGSTAAAAQFDPEEWSQIINGAFQPMIRPVYRYEGTVARLMGDGLLAFFGAPIAHEDDPVRAVLAGLEILDGIRDYRATARRQWGIELDVRVGVNTGLVVVGAVGSDLRMEYSALGDAINIAARMEQTAQPGTVQIAENTYQLVAPLFDFETIDALEVKGRAEPMKAYRVLGRQSAPGSLRGIVGLTSALVGRDQELAQLTEALSVLAGGRGGIVAIVGEAGLGKTRLTAEARRAVGENDGAPLWIEGRSLSFDTATPYALFKSALTQSVSLPSNMDDTERYGHLKLKIERILPGRGEEIAPLLANVMDIPVPPPDDERIRFLEPPMLRGAVFNAVAVWLEALVSAHSTVLFLDDLHWSDPTSLELLQLLMPLTERVPLLILLAFRPRPQDASWQLHEAAARDYTDRYTSIALRPLDDSHSRRLVSNLLTIEDLPDKVRNLILDKAEGNPFFLEEVIRSLLDAGLVVRQGDYWRATREIVNLRVPDKLVGVITARLDRLDDSSRQVAQAAAVLGREFSFDLLADITGQDRMLEERLAILQNRDLVREIESVPDRCYIFKHALTHDAAYDSLLLSRRRQLHHLAGDALQRRKPEAATEIAHHYLEARQPTTALPFLVLAGQQASAGYATKEAVSHFARALEYEQLGDTATVRAAFEGLGAIQSLGADLPLALTTYQRMLDVAEARGDLPMTVSALNKLGGLLGLMMGQFDQAEAYLARAERLTAGEEDPDGFAELSIIRCQICTAQADFDSVIRYMDGVVASSLKLGNDHNLSLGLGHTTSSQIFLNRYEDAAQTAEQALTLARRIGDRPHEAELLTFAYPLIYIRDGDLDRANATLEQGLQLAERIGAINGIADASWLMGEIARMRGEYEAALVAGQRAFEAALPLEGFLPFYLVHALSLLGSIYLEISDVFIDKVAQFHRHALQLLENPVGAIGGGAAWADLGWCAMTLGDLEIASDVFTKGLHHPTMMMNLEKPRYLAGTALLHSLRDEHEPAERLAVEALAYAEEYGMRHLYPLVRLTHGRVLSANDRHEDALAEYAIAEETARTMNQRPILWQTCAAASRSLLILGRHAEAAQKQDKAHTVLDEIAGLFKDEELRAAFRDYASRRLRTITEVD